MPDIDRERFAADVTAFLGRRGLSYREAVFVWPALNPAMLSRGARRQVLSAASMLTVCRAFGLDPFDYLELPEKEAANPAVTAMGSRETRGDQEG